MKKFWKRTEGFTLVELVVVIAILGILAGVGTVGYSGYVKKANVAADQQLLAAVNQAFAAACVENGENTANVTAGNITLTDGKIASDALVVSAPATKVDDIEEDFWKYFVGNESAEFKVFNILTYANGVFVGNAAEGQMYGNYYANDNDVESLRNSVWAEKYTASELLNMVDSVAGGVQDVYGAQFNTMSGTANYKAAAAAALGMSVADYDTYYADVVNTKTQEYRNNGMNLSAARTQATSDVNSTIAVVVASKNAQTEGSSIIDTLKANGGVGAKELIKGNVNSTENATQGLSQAALAYGLYNAYVQNNDEITDKATATEVGRALNNFDDPDFQAYLQTEQAQKDLAGLMASFNIVGTQSQDAIKNTVSGGITNADLIASLDEMMGK